MFRWIFGNFGIGSHDFTAFQPGSSSRYFLFSFTFMFWSLSTVYLLWLHVLVNFGRFLVSGRGCTCLRLHTWSSYRLEQSENGLIKKSKVHLISFLEIWAVSRQNQHNGFATSMDPDQPVLRRSLIRIHAVRYQFLYLLQGL
jgi:hypothetical protein